MANKKIVDLRKKSVEELHKRVLDLKRELMNLRFQKARGELEKTNRFRQARREIAVIKTLESQKKLELKRGVI